MPKEMITAKMTRAQGKPWGFVIVGGKDQALTVKLGRIKPYSAAEAAGLKVHCDAIRWEHFCGDVVLDSFNMVYSNEDSI